MGACSSSTGPVGETLEVAGRRIRVLSEIGQGGYSFIYKCNDVKDKGSFLALKRTLAQDEEQLDNAQREIKMFKSFSGCSGVLPLLGSASRPAPGAPPGSKFVEVLLLLPLARGSVFARVAAGAIYDETPALELALRVCQALSAMHARGFVHGDLKPQNILLLDSGPALCDFGSCRPVNRPVESRGEGLRIQEDAERYCTASYRAPELHDVKTGSDLDGKVDVFGLGCTLFFTAVGRNPYDHPTEGFLKLALLQGACEFAEKDRSRLSKGFRALVRAMLRADAKRRLSIEAVEKRISKLLDA